ncbi:MAG TPA: carbohydrate kinase family protein [Terracidiphilus sp.]|nr:carbohydrate kinase family protein [Terracidiphilus sp.]
MTLPFNPDGSYSHRIDVTVVGDCCVDILMYGLSEELPCERELLATDMAIRIGGSGAITSHNLAALGTSTGFITALASDEFGKLCHAELHSAGVDLSRCVLRSETRAGVTVHLQHKELRHMFTYAGTIFELSFDDLDIDYLASTRHLHMPSYYLQRALTPRIPELFGKLKAAGLTISLDPNDDPANTWDRCILDALPFVDVLIPNEREACLIAAEPRLDDAIAALRKMVPLLIVKRGSKGASAYTRNDDCHVPVEPVRIVDAVGAGDSFNAGFLHAWLHGRNIRDALAFGNVCGSASTTMSGGTPAFREPASLQQIQSAWKKEVPNL